MQGDSLTDKQGALYQRVIAAVVEASRTDFEENGIDNATLMSLQEVSPLSYCNIPIQTRRLSCIFVSLVGSKRKPLHRQVDFGIRAPGSFIKFR